MEFQRTGRIGRLAGVAAAICLGLANLAAAPATAWIGAWASAQQVPEPNNALPADDLADATLRQVVRLSAGGPQIRVRVSNAFGTGVKRAPVAREEIAVYHRAGGQADTRFAATLLDS